MAHKFNYFKALTHMAEFCCQAARYFNEVVDDFDPAQLSKYIEEMHQIEHAADEKRHEIMHSLAKEFLPPIEREDIVEIASKIDDITDCIDDVMQHLYIYNVKKLLPECKDFAKLILQCCESILCVAKEFSGFRKSSTILENIIVANNLESEGDKLYSEIMRKIFTSEMTDKETLIWARIIKAFEDCCDYCEDAAELFESAIMKNS